MSLSFPVQVLMHHQSSLVGGFKRKTVRVPTQPARAKPPERLALWFGEFVKVFLSRAPIRFSDGAFVEWRDFGPTHPVRTASPLLCVSHELSLLQSKGKCRSKSDPREKSGSSCPKAKFRGSRALLLPRRAPRARRGTVPTWGRAAAGSRRPWLRRPRTAARGNAGG